MKTKNQQLITNNYLGQSLFEVILSLAVLSVVLTAIVSLASKSISTSTLSKNKAQANRYASEAIEFTRTQKEFLGWKNFKTKIGTGVWCLNTLTFDDLVCHCHIPCTSSETDNIPGTIFDRTLEVKNATSKSMEVEVKVRWIDEKGTHETYTVSAISDW